MNPEAYLRAQRALAERTAAAGRRNGRSPRSLRGAAWRGAVGETGGRRFDGQTLATAPCHSPEKPVGFAKVLRGACNSPPHGAWLRPCLLRSFFTNGLSLGVRIDEVLSRGSYCN